MRSYKFEKFFIANNIAFRKDEGYPPVFSALEIRDVYYLPSAEIVLDFFDVLSEEQARQLEMSGYPVYLLTTEPELKRILEYHHVSNNSF